MLYCWRCPGTVKLWIFSMQIYGWYRCAAAGHMSWGSSKVLFYHALNFCFCSWGIWEKHFALSIKAEKCHGLAVPCLFCVCSCLCTCWQFSPVQLFPVWQCVPLQSAFLFPFLHFFRQSEKKKNNDFGRYIVTTYHVLLNKEHIVSQVLSMPLH